MGFPRKVLININSEELYKGTLQKSVLWEVTFFALVSKLISFVFLTLIDNLLAFSQVETGAGR